MVKSDDQKPLDEHEASAYFIATAHKDFKKLVYAVADRKKHAVPRVLEAMLFEPLEEIALFGKQEEELFDLCQQVMFHKGKVLEYAFKRMEKIKQGELNEHEEK